MEWNHIFTPLLSKTYHKLFKEFLSWCLDMVAESSHSPSCLFSGDLFSFDQFLDQHDSRVTSGLHGAINKQIPAKFT